VDAKVPRSYRDQIPILCDQEKICWIAGYRLDDRVKITPQTKQVLIVEIR
jgi:tRNA(Ile)-lysidine synthase